MSTTCNHPECKNQFECLFENKPTPVPIEHLFPVSDEPECDNYYIQFRHNDKHTRTMRTIHMHDKTIGLIMFEYMRSMGVQVKLLGSTERNDTFIIVKENA